MALGGLKCAASALFLSSRPGSFRDASGTSGRELAQASGSRHPHELRLAAKAPAILVGVSYEMAFLEGILNFHEFKYLQSWKLCLPKRCRNA